MLSFEKICEIYCPKLISENYYISNCKYLVEIFNSNNPSETTIKYDSQNGPIIFNLLGLYFHHVKKDYKIAKHYYIKSIEKNDSEAMYRNQTRF